jgi:hypothetical protein
MTWKVKKLIYLREEIFFASSSSHPFSPYFFCFWGFIICVILSISLPHERNFSYLVVFVTLEIMKDLERLYGIFKKLTLLYFMHGWECRNISCFWSRGG